MGHTYVDKTGMLLWVSGAALKWRFGELCRQDYCFCFVCGQGRACRRISKAPNYCHVSDPAIPYSTGAPNSAKEAVPEQKLYSHV